MNEVMTSERDAVDKLVAEVAELREALEYVANLRSAYWVRPMNGHGWRLIETDCGAMIVCGEGFTPLEAIRNARSGK